MLSLHISFTFYQRRRRHFKSGQATANKRSLMHVNGDGGVYNRQVVQPRSKPTWLTRPVHNFLLSKRSYRERQGLVGSLRKRPTLRARLRSRTTASSGMRHIASNCTSYTHLYLATHGCRCSPVGPRRAPDQPVKERERLRETRTRTAKASLRGTPGPIVSSSDRLCSLDTRPTTC